MGSFIIASLIIFQIVGMFNVILFAALFSILFFEGLNWSISKMSLLHAFYLNYKVDRWVKLKLPFYYETELHTMTTCPSYRIDGKRNYELYCRVRIKDKFRYMLIENGQREISTATDRIIMDYRGNIISENILKNIHWIEENIDRGMLKQFERDIKLKRVLS